MNSGKATFYQGSGGFRQKIRTTGGSAGGNWGIPNSREVDRAFTGCGLGVLWLLMASGGRTVPASQGLKTLRIWRSKPSREASQSVPKRSVDGSMRPGIKSVIGAESHDSARSQFSSAEGKGKGLPLR
jgi:hypothetical protein